MGVGKTDANVFKMQGKLLSDQKDSCWGFTLEPSTVYLTTPISNQPLALPDRSTSNSGELCCVISQMMLRLLNIRGFSLLVFPSMRS